MLAPYENWGQDHLGKKLASMQSRKMTLQCLGLVHSSRFDLNSFQTWLSPRVKDYQEKSRYSWLWIIVIVFENVYKKCLLLNPFHQINEWQITVKCQTKWRCLKNLIGASIKSLPSQIFFVSSQTKLSESGQEGYKNMKFVWSSVFYHWIRIYQNK